MPLWIKLQGHYFKSSVCCFFFFSFFLQDRYAALSDIFSSSSVFTALPFSTRSLLFHPPHPPNPERLLHIQASALTGFSPLLVCLVGFTHSSAVLPIRHLTHSVPINMHQPLLSASLKLSQQPPFLKKKKKMFFYSGNSAGCFIFLPPPPAPIHLLLLPLCADSH